MFFKKKIIFNAVQKVHLVFIRRYWGSISGSHIYYCMCLNTLIYCLCTFSGQRIFLGILKDNFLNGQNKPFLRSLPQMSRILSVQRLLQFSVILFIYTVIMARREQKKTPKHEMLISISIFMVCTQRSFGFFLSYLMRKLRQAFWPTRYFSNE